MSNDNGPDNSPDERQNEIIEEGPLNVFVRGLVRRRPDLAVSQEIPKERRASESSNRIRKDPMGRVHLAVVAGLILSAHSLEAQEFPSLGGTVYRTLLRAAYNHFERFAAFLVPSKIGFLADGGGSDGGGSGSGGSDGGGTGGGSGDGGSGDGGSGDGGSGAAGAGAGAAGSAGTGGASDGTGGAGTGGTGDGTGGAGTGGTGDGTGGAGTGGTGDGTGGSTDGGSTDGAAGDSAAAAAAAATTATTTTTTTTTSAAAPGNTDDDAPSNDNNDNNNDNTDPPAVTVNNAPTTQQTDQTTVTPELAAIMSIPTTDPRGGEVVSPTVTNGAPGGAALAPGGPAPTEPVDVEIHAVIVSAAQSPWDAVQRWPGIRNVIVVGGIVALGKTPIPGEIPGGGPQPPWLRVIPDLELLNGSKIPPVVPNVIDVRIMNCPIKIENLPE